MQFSDKGSGEKRYLLAGEFPDGRKVYKTNYPKGTPKSVKQQDIINIVQNVWSKKPITLNIGNEQIEAQFDPELTDRSDLSKIAFGNRKGNASDKRITLNLSSDLYMIASDAVYTGLKKEVGKKDNPAHDNVIQWRYFATNLIYEEEDGTLIPCYMNIDVKQKADGNYFYSFAIEKGTAPQTLLAVVNDEKSPTVPNNNIPHQEAIVNNNDMQKSQNNSQESNGKQHLLGAVIEEGATTKENTAVEYNSTAKSRTRLERYENEAVRKVADAMSVRLGTAREFLKPIIQEMSNEYMKTGKLSQETVDRLFEEAYKNGRKVNDEAYKEYADLRNYLRNAKIYFDSESAADISDFFKDIRRYMGRLSVSSTNGTSVDSIYQELNEMHPSLFPEDILSSSDRMLRIMEVSDSLRKEEVTLDTYYNTEETKGDLKQEFEKAVYAFKDNLYEVKHFNDSLESDVVEKTTKKPLKEGEIEAPESFEELCGKGLVKVINISKPEDMRTYRQRRIDIRKNAEKAEIFSKPYENRDTGMKIFIVPNSYTHTFSNKGEENIRVAEHLPELIENAVLTHKEEMRNAEESSDYMYTFFAAVDDNGIKAVKLKVKQYSNRNVENAPENIKKYFSGDSIDYSTLYDAKVLAIEEINIIKEPDASGKKPYNPYKASRPTSSSISNDASGEVPNNESRATQSTSVSNISVSQLMKLVKGDAEKYGVP